MSKLRVVETDELESSVYLFQNTKHNINIFVDAAGYNDAKIKFDLCEFKNRTEWKIFVECGDQPA
jgi:hypothetical protein